MKYKISSLCQMQGENAPLPGISQLYSPYEVSNHLFPKGFSGFGGGGNGELKSLLTKLPLFYGLLYIRCLFLSIWTNLQCFLARTNSWTKSRQKFSSLLFTVTSAALLWDFYFFKITQPITVSLVQLLYTVKEKGGKPDRKPSRLNLQSLISWGRRWKEKSPYKYVKKTAKIDRRKSG